MVEWPDIKFGPINLWVMSPAWWFYMSKEERVKLVEESILLDIRSTEEQPLDLICNN